MRVLSLTLIALGFATFIACDRGTGDGDTTTDGGDFGDAGDADTDADADADADTDADADADIPCSEPSDWDSFYGAIDAALVTEDDYTHDANLSEVMAMAPTKYFEEVTGLSIAVTEAVVTNVGFPPSASIWMQDMNGAARTFLSDASELSKGDTPVPGDRVSFVATELSNYFGEIEIIEIEPDSWEIISSGNPVQVRDGLGVPLDYATMGMTNWRTWGKITAFIEKCGPANCWELTHGGITSEVRASDLLGWQEGDCIELTAPVIIFEDVPRYDMINFDWGQWY